MRSDDGFLGQRSRVLYEALDAGHRLVVRLYRFPDGTERPYVEASEDHAEARPPTVTALPEAVHLLQNATERELYEIGLRDHCVEVARAHAATQRSHAATTAALNATRAQVLALLLGVLPFEAWRHHGIGVLQAYLHEGTEPELRVHVWHPDLVRAGIRESGSVHDHRFDLESRVVVGEIRERVFTTEPAADGEWEAWHVENARSAGAGRGFDGECRPNGETLRADIVNRLHCAGDTYTLGRHVFHETLVDGLAVTLCTMREKRGSARLLVPRGREPVHAFGAPASEAVIRRILHEARTELVRGT